MIMKHKCKWDICNALIDMNEKYCDKHRDKVDQLSNKKQKIKDKQYNKQRWNDDNKQFTSFYHTTAWIKAREVCKVRANGLCEECLRQGKIRPGRIADHIVPLRIDWSRRLDPTNLQYLCQFHHNLKTNKEQEEKNKMKK